MDELERLQEENERIDLSGFKAGDTITIKYREFTHEEDRVFTGVEDETRTATFTIDRKTHPKGSDVESILWDGTKPPSSGAISVDDTRTISENGYIIGWVEDICYS